MANRTITPEARVTIQRRWDAGDNVKDIAQELGVGFVTVYRELERGRTGKLNAIGRPEYSPELGRINYYASIANRGNRNKRKGNTNG